MYDDNGIDDETGRAQFEQDNQDDDNFGDALAKIISSYYLTFRSQEGHQEG
jgi:hypothetical protein